MTPITIYFSLLWGIMSDMEFLRINKSLSKTEKSKEIIVPSPDRILILGSRLSGAMDLAD